MDAQNIAQTLHNLFRTVIPQPQQPDADMNDTPSLEPMSTETSPSSSEAAPTTDGNASVDTAHLQPTSGGGWALEDDEESMPQLQSVSDSPGESSSNSDRDANEVEMQAVEDDHDSSWTDEENDDPALPSLESITVPQSSAPRSANRRARVEDDEDEDRDRRHPSQRVSNTVDSQTAGLPSAIPIPPTPLQQPPQPPQPPHIRATINLPGAPFGIGNPADPFRFIQHMMQDQNPNATAPTADTNPNNNPTALPNNPNPTRTPMFGGFAITIDLNAAPGTPQHPPTPGGAHAHAHVHTHTHRLGPVFPLPGGAPRIPGDFVAFRDLLTRFGIFGHTFGSEHEQEDPERAKRLVDGLEEVPLGLVRRLERVGSGDEEGGGSGGDSGCAICWDRLLDGDGETFGGGADAGTEGKMETEPQNESAHGEPSSSVDLAASASSSSPSTRSDTTELTHPKIVSLPCAHVFHASCLIPWFSRPRQTTCPTCRFNIDPENLTWVRRRHTPSATNTNAGPGPATTAAEASTQPTFDNVPLPSIPSGADGVGANAGHTGNPPIQLLTPFAIDTMSLGTGAPPTPGTPGVAPNPDVARISERARRMFEQRQRERDMMTFSTPAMPTAMDADGDHGGHPDPSTPEFTAGPSVAPDTTRNTFQPSVQPTANPSAARPSAPSPNPNVHAVPNPNPNHFPHDFLTFGFDIIIGTQPGDMDMGMGMGMGMADGDEMADVEQEWNDNLPDVFNIPDGQNPGVGNPNFGINNPNPGINNPNPGINNPNPGVGNAPPAEANNAAPFPPPAMLPDMGGGVHIAAGAGRTMGEAFNQLFHGQGDHLPDNAPPTPGNPDPSPGNAMPNAQNGPAAPDPRTPAQFHDFLSHLLDTVPGGGFGRIIPLSVPGLGFANMPPHGLGQLPNTDPGTPNINHFQAQVFPIGFAVAGRPMGTATGAPTTGAGARAPPAGPTGPIPANGVPPHFAPMFRNVAFPGPFQVPGEPVGAGAGAGTDAPHMHPHFGPRPSGMAPPRMPRERKQWTLPPPPGLTLRQRIEKKEREAGLRCYDVSCGIGPSDEDPFASVPDEAMRQLSIRSSKDVTHGTTDTSVCDHTFHSSCLVSSERVALMGEEASIVGDDVEVSCSVCRCIGCVSKADWDEGVQALS